ncbi:MAG: glycosyltransferase family 2 protein [Candidatus Bathyarchaeota archaeon]|nr:glycosyltransferase family 2 protein [Candidatus Bathyarchaeota archaeon]
MLHYPAPTQPSPLIWNLPLNFFYTWYVFFAIGVSGFLLVAAWSWKQRATPETERSYPMVSFVVPAYNEEQNITHCLNSLFNCAVKFRGAIEVVVVDDGSTDNTYEAAWNTIKSKPEELGHIRTRVVRHTSNLGKAEALRSGVNKAMGEYVAIVDADTCWESHGLTELVDYMNSTMTLAASGYIHPSDGVKEHKLFVILQQLEYSQGLGILRRAEALGNAVTVVPGPMGLYRSEVLRQLLNEKQVKSVTEDLEFTLEMQKKNMKIGYDDAARSTTLAPTTLKWFWRQRLRWSIGWLHNQLAIHRDLLWNKRWLTLFLWYSLVPGFLGAALELIALLSTVVFFWFAPDRIFYLLNLAFFMLLVLIVGLTQQAIALKFAYSKYNHRQLLWYMPLYFLLRFINIFAKFTTLIQYMMGKRGNWHKS